MTTEKKVMSTLGIMNEFMNILKEYGFEYEQNSIRNFIRIKGKIIGVSGSWTQVIFKYDRHKRLIIRNFGNKFEIRIINEKGFIPKDIDLPKEINIQYSSPYLWIFY